VLTSWKTSGGAVLLYLGLAALAAAYVIAAARPSPRGNRWPATRTLCWLAGLAVLVLAYGSDLAVHEDDPVNHVVQHMLVMMAAPPLLLYAAPMTLTLRTLGPKGRRSVVQFFDEPSMRLLSGRAGPAFLLIDYYLTMFLYQLTPLRTFTEDHAWAHVAMHQYFFVCGLAFWFPVAGVDPVRLRLSRRAKLVMIGVGLPLFLLLGLIVLAQGRTSTGWTYIVGGAALTALALVTLIARREPQARRSAAQGEFALSQRV
jgi:putative membrane protein